MKPPTRDPELDDRLEDLFCASCDEVECTAIAATDRDVVGSPRFSKQCVDQGRAMAIASYFSVMFGIPVFVVPLYMRDNKFALHHARSAGVIFVACTAMLLAALLNSAVFLPLVFVCYIPALVGIYRASAGVEAGTAALGPAGERILGRIEVRSEGKSSQDRGDLR